MQVLTRLPPISWTLLLVVTLSAESAQAATTYTLTDLGDFPGSSDFSEARDLNASGVVVGNSLRSTGPGLYDVARRGFVWENGVMTDVGDLPGGDDESRAVAINASGQVVGFSAAAAGRRPFLWESGAGILDLSLEPGSPLFFEASDINDAGQVVGQCSGLTPTRACVWESGNPIVDLGVVDPPNTFSVPEAINASALVVGWGAIGSTGGIRGLSWSGLAGTPNDLGELGGGEDRSIAFDVNDVGQIVGRSNAGSGDRAVLWDGGPPIDLGELPGGENHSEAFGINDLGEIVGVSGDGSGDRGVLWDTTGGPYHLNDRLDASGAGYEIFDARAINDAGQIAANANVGGVQHAVLLTPVPEPGVLAGTLASVAVLALCASRRVR
jgi:probable HAF family extracellular repeat protein